MLGFAPPLGAHRLRGAPGRAGRVSRATYLPHPDGDARLNWPAPTRVVLDFGPATTLAVRPAPPDRYTNIRSCDLYPAFGLEPSCTCVLDSRVPKHVRHADTPSVRKLVQLSRCIAVHPNGYDNARRANLDSDLFKFRVCRLDIHRFLRALCHAVVSPLSASHPVTTSQAPSFVVGSITTVRSRALPSVRPIMRLRPGTLSLKKAGPFHSTSRTSSGITR